MSKISDTVFDQLVEGKPPTVVRTAITSQSQFADGLQKYLQWASSKAKALKLKSPHFRASSRT
jgi:hypothetical protein